MNEDSAQIVKSVVALIPDGKVASYGQIADLAGLPGRARFVGRVLGSLSSNSSLPWHRVIRSDGHIVTREGGREQISRLRAEGVCVTDCRVNIKHYGWEPTS